VYDKQNEAIIVKANKGNSVIIIEEKMYDEKVKNLINENNSVLKNNNPTNNLKELSETV
jgi:hypothetical protein